MAPRSRTRSPNAARSKRTSVAAGIETATVRISSKPTLIGPFHVAVDRQLKSGHDTYKAAEKAALTIKTLHATLHVTVYDAKNQRHAVIEQPAVALNRNRIAAPLARNALEHHHVSAAGAKP